MKDFLKQIQHVKKMYFEGMHPSINSSGMGLDIKTVLDFKFSEKTFELIDIIIHMLAKALCKDFKNIQEKDIYYNLDRIMPKNLPAHMITFRDHVYEQIKKAKINSKYSIAFGNEETFNHLKADLGISADEKTMIILSTILEYVTAELIEMAVADELWGIRTGRDIEYTVLLNSIEKDKEIKEMLTNIGFFKELPDIIMSLNGVPTSPIKPEKSPVYHPIITSPYGTTVDYSKSRSRKSPVVRRSRKSPKARRSRKSPKARSSRKSPKARRSRKSPKARRSRKSRSRKVRRSRK